MNEVAMLHEAELRKILQTVIGKKVPAIMSYLSKGKWHVAKVLPTNLGADKLAVCVLPGKKPHPINVQVHQPVGISLKYEYGKFIFDFRVDVPRLLKVNILLWHRGKNRTPGPVTCDPDERRTTSDEPRNYWQGKLVDISAGGAQIAVDAGQRGDFKKWQFIGLRFTPMPYEMPLMLNAQIRNILPTADEKSICLGLQIVGLEASHKGRGVLRRLCDVVERYYQINQSSAKQQDMQPIGFNG